MWGLHTGKLLREFMTNQDVSSVCVTPDGAEVVAGTMDGNVQVWGVNSGKLLHTLRVGKAMVLSLCVTPEYLVTGAQRDNRGFAARVWWLKRKNLHSTSSEERL